MTRFSIAHWSLLFAVIALALYAVKYKVQDIREEVVALEKALKEERETLQVLKAEWGYLNRPERLRALSENYLQMQAPSAAAMMSIEALPERRETLALHQTGDR